MDDSPWPPLRWPPNPSIVVSGEYVELHPADPDRDAVALEDIKKRFKIETGRTEEGHVVADAIQYSQKEPRSKEVVQP